MRCSHVSRGTEGNRALRNSGIDGYGCSAVGRVTVEGYLDIPIGGFPDENSMFSGQVRLWSLSVQKFILCYYTQIKLKGGTFVTSQFESRSSRILRKRWILAPLSFGIVIVLLLATSCLAFGAPAPAKPSSPAQSPPTDPGALTATAGSADGFRQTVMAFQSVQKKGRELSVTLQELHAEVVARTHGDTAKQQAHFLKKLLERYPGSTYDGANGTVMFQKGGVATFNNTFTVDSLKEIGAVTVTYVLGNYSIILEDGSSTVTVVIDRVDPYRSRFTAAVIPAMKDEANKILTVPGYKRTTTDSVEASILNDAYQQLNQATALQMEQFAADVMSVPASQRTVLGIARKGYLDRNPRDYQKGPEPAKPVLKNSYGVSHPGTPKMIIGIVARLLLLGALAAGFFWLVSIVIRRVKYQFMDNVTKMNLKKYNDLSPMVTRSLKNMGTALWGKNRLWSKKYYIVKRNDRWLLCDDKADQKSQKSLAKNRLEVCMRDVNFKLRITRLNGVGVDMAVTCKDFSEQELAERLKEIRTLFTTENPT